MLDPGRWSRGWVWSRRWVRRASASGMICWPAHRASRRSRRSTCRRAAPADGGPVTGFDATSVDCADEASADGRHARYAVVVTRQAFEDAAVPGRPRRRRRGRRCAGHVHCRRSNDERVSDGAAQGRSDGRTGVAVQQHGRERAGEPRRPRVQASRTERDDQPEGGVGPGGNRGRHRRAAPRPQSRRSRPAASMRSSTSSFASHDRFEVMAPTDEHRARPVRQASLRIRARRGRLRAAAREEGSARYARRTDLRRSDSVSGHLSAAVSINALAERRGAARPHHARRTRGRTDLTPADVMSSMQRPTDAGAGSRRGCCAAAKCLVRRGRW